MPRIAGVNIPTNKRVEIGLTYIFGIGRKSSQDICSKANIPDTKRVSQLTDDEVLRIREIIDQDFQVEGDLRRGIGMNIKRLMDLGCYRGLRHRKGLPVRGQRTHSNARTRKGPAKAIAGKKKNVDMALFFFSEEFLSTILEERQQNNVQIRALIEPRFAYRDYSTALDMWGLQSSQDCKTGKSSAWKQTIKTMGIPNLVTGDMLHHKFAILDRQLVLTGSHNWSKAANHINDETLVAIQNETVAAHYQREFDRLYQDAIFGPTAKLVQATAKSCAQRGKNKPQEAIEEPES